jgi:hypothetical protein
MPEGFMNEIVSTSLLGLQQARNDIETAARRIAAWPAVPDTQTRRGSSPGTAIPQDIYAPSSQPDLVADLLTIRQAKTAAEADLKVLSRELALEKSTLDLIG